MLVQTTERYLGCKQRIHNAVNDRIGPEAIEVCCSEWPTSPSSQRTYGHGMTGHSVWSFASRSHFPAHDDEQVLHRSLHRVSKDEKRTVTTVYPQPGSDNGLQRPIVRNRAVTGYAQSSSVDFFLLENQ
jgi:hypothetical protein